MYLNDIYLELPKNNYSNLNDIVFKCNLFNIDHYDNHHKVLTFLRDTDGLNNEEDGHTIPSIAASAIVQLSCAVKY